MISFNQRIDISQLREINKTSRLIEEIWLKKRHQKELLKDVHRARINAPSSRSCKSNRVVRDQHMEQHAVPERVPNLAVMNAEISLEVMESENEWKALELVDML